MSDTPAGEGRTVGPIYWPSADEQRGHRAERADDVQRETLRRRVLRRILERVLS